ncbi:ATP synthase F1 subunit delta [bacterium]|nr:ATP synthase F1 subunit delta [bacterium]
MTTSSTSSPGEAAQRYAAAVFELALDSGDVDGVEAGFTAIAKLIEGDAALNRAMRSPLYKSEEKAGVLETLCGKLKSPDLVRRAVGVAAMNRRAGDIPAIARAFATRAARHRGATQVTARVAHQVSEAQAAKLESDVSRALGRTVKVQIEVDPALIAGMQLRFGSKLIDASVRTKLNQLTTIMKGM